MKRITWIVLGCVSLATAHAASFDCSHPSTKIQKTICGDAELSRLDEEMDAAYMAALADEKHADAISRFQERWVAQRNGCINVGCVKESVKDLYDLQLSFLKLPVVTTPAAKLVPARSSYTATLLANGQVLIAGGSGTNGGFTANLDSAELYDPATGKFTSTGKMTQPRSWHTAVLLADGQVLLAGGTTNALGGSKDVRSAELYDPASGTFSPTGSFSAGTIHCSATLLADGKVLFIGRKKNNDPSVEVYDPATGRFNAAGDPVNTWCDSTATPLPNGKVLITGELGAALYDPGTGKFRATGPMVADRTDPAAALLPNGKVLVTGGTAGGHRLASAELYDPETGQFSRTGDMKTARWGHSTVPLPTGKVLVARGYWTDPMIYPSLELYDPANGTFSFVGRFSECYSCTAVPLKDGRVLFLGDGSAEIYDPAAGEPQN